jgi:hypothetical protein
VRRKDAGATRNRSSRSGRSRTPSFSWPDRMCVLPGDSCTSKEFTGGHRSSGARQVSPPRWPGCGCQDHEKIESGETANRVDPGGTYQVSRRNWVTRTPEPSEPVVPDPAGRGLPPSRGLTGCAYCLETPAHRGSSQAVTVRAGLDKSRRRGGQIVVVRRWTNLAQETLIK